MVHIVVSLYFSYCFYVLPLHSILQNSQYQDDKCTNQLYFYAYPNNQCYLDPHSTETKYSTKYVDNTAYYYNSGNCTGQILSYLRTDSCTAISAATYGKSEVISYSSVSITDVDDDSPSAPPLNTSLTFEIPNNDDGDGKWYGSFYTVFSFLFPESSTGILENADIKTVLYALKRVYNITAVTGDKRNIILYDSQKQTKVAVSASTVRHTLS